MCLRRRNALQYSSLAGIIKRLFHYSSPNRTSYFKTYSERLNSFSDIIVIREINERSKKSSNFYLTIRICKINSIVNNVEHEKYVWTLTIGGGTNIQFNESLH